MGTLKRYPTIAVLLLFALLTVIYFRYTFGASSDALLTKHLATDLYGHFVHVWERLIWLKQGFIPIGDYWVPRGGGFPAASNDQMVIPQEFLLMVIYAITDNFAIALRVLIPLFYLATLATSYWYGTTILGNRTASVVLAVAYSFSMYGANQLEHLELIGVQPLILLTLIYLEKTLAGKRPKHILLTSIFLFSVFLSNLYATFFTLMFIGFRLGFWLLTQPKRRVAITSTAQVGAFFLLLAVPFLLPQVLNMPTEQMKAELARQLTFYAQPPSLYFLRNTVFQPYLTEIYFMYLGLLVLVLTTIPMIIRRAPSKLYVFHLLVAAFFLLYSIGQYSPYNLAIWFNQYFPLAFFVRVPGRSLMIGYLSLAVCAAIGFTIIASRYKRQTILMLIIVLVIFVDLTVGFEPTTMEPLAPQEGVYQYLRAQPGEFRIIEVSSVHDQQAMTTIYTGHDTLNSILWGFGFFAPLRTFTGLYSDYVDRKASSQEAALYDVRYIIVNSDPNYTKTYQDAIRAIDGPTLLQVRAVDSWLSHSKDYKLVYSTSYTNIYENLAYRGSVFSLTGSPIQHVRIDPNTLLIDVEGPTSVIISQSYSDNWVAQSNDEALPVHNYRSVQLIEVPAGTHHIVLYYQSYKSWSVMALLFLIAFCLTLLWLYKERLWFILPLAGAGISLLLLLSPLPPPVLYQEAVAVLGVALIIVPTVARIISLR